MTFPRSLCTRWARLCLWALQQKRESAGRRRRREDPALVAATADPVRLTAREKAMLATSERPHEHFELREPRDVLLWESQTEQLRSCVECRCRISAFLHEHPEVLLLMAARLADRRDDPLMTYLCERSRRGDAVRLALEEKAWRDADRGVPS